jgi:phage major head subunit gpT-like protein
VDATPGALPAYASRAKTRLMADRAERLSAEKIELLAPSKDEPRKFSMLAYTGIEIGRGWGRMIVDLAGVERDERMVMLLEHDDRSPVAVCTKHEVTKKGLVLSGYFLPTEHAAEVCKLADAGLPWKASIGIRFLETSEVEEGADADVNGQQLKGPLTVVRRCRLFETSFITANPADLGTEAAVMHEERAPMADKNKAQAPSSNGEAGRASAAPAASETLRTELAAAFPKRPKFVERMVAQGKTVPEAHAILAAQLEKKIADLKKGTVIQRLEVDSRDRGLGFQAPEATSANLKHLPVEERARIEVGNDNRIYELFQGTPDRTPEQLYAQVLRYEARKRVDGTRLMDDEVLELAAKFLRKTADARFGPIDGERLGSYGKSGPDYSLIVNKGFLGQFYASFEQELAGIWAPKVGLRVESNQETETHRWLGMFPQLNEWLGNVREDGMPIYSFAITNKLYRASIGIDKNDFKFQKFGLISMRMGEAGAIAAEHWNALVSTLLENNGTCYDGSSFFATNHNLGGSAPTSQTNDLSKTDYPALGVADPNNVSELEFANAVRAVVPHLRTLVWNNGQPMNGGMKKVAIMVPQNLEGVATGAVSMERLNLGQSNTLKSQLFDVEIIPNPRLTKKNVFYVLRLDSNNKPFILQEPGPPETLFQGPGSYLEWVQHKYGFGIETTRAAGYGAWESSLRCTFGV